MSSSFLLSLIVLLALTCPILAVRPTLVAISNPVAPPLPVRVGVPSPPVVVPVLSPPVVVPTSSPPVEASLAAPVISSITGCDSVEKNQVQCPVGATLLLFVSGLADSATVRIGSSYDCAVTSLNATCLFCTLPTSIQSLDFNLNFTVTVTSGGQTSAPVAGVTFLPQAVSLTITTILGCLGGNGTTVYACRQGYPILIVGSGIYKASYQVMIGSYPCSNPTFYALNQLRCWLPVIADVDLNVPLPVTISVNGTSATYTPGLISYGLLAVNTISGCGKSAPPISGCAGGDVLTLTGTGFNMGQPGDANNLRFAVSGPYPSNPTFTVLSNTEIQLILPSPMDQGYMYSFYFYAGPTGPPGFNPIWFIQYAPVPLVTRTYGGVLGCSYSQQVKAPLCQAGDVLQAFITGANSSDVQAVNVVSPSSGNSYTCGSLYTNGTALVSCTVPAVNSSDLNQLLGVSITVGGTIGPSYTSGLFMPSA